jgi:hypothetical protein
MFLECTTTVYSFGKRILETKQLQSGVEKSGKFIYSFGFVNGFFTAFLSGFQYLSSECEALIAIQHLSILQVLSNFLFNALIGI